MEVVSEILKFPRGVKFTPWLKTTVLVYRLNLSSSLDLFCPVINLFLPLIEDSAVSKAANIVNLNLIPSH